MPIKDFTIESILAYDPKATTSNSEKSDSKNESVSSTSEKTPKLISHSKRRIRTAYTKFQLELLEREFTENKYLSLERRTELAELVGVQQDQIKIWFQNRRTKWKRENSTDWDRILQQLNNEQRMQCLTLLGNTSEDCSNLLSNLTDLEK